MTNLELQKKTKTLMMALHDLKHEGETHSRLLGMAEALLTTEQLETMVRYLEQWITEKAEKENQ
jgi:hypothetical protein